MNTFSDMKVFNFGRLIRRKWPTLKWTAITFMDDWDKAVETYELTDEQIEFVKRGFEGSPFKEKVSVGNMPFGLHINKPLEEIPLNYYYFLLTKDWIDKWPAVKAYAKHVISINEKDSLDKNEAIDILQELKKQLK